MASTPETIALMNKAKELAQNGNSISLIAKKLKRSESRIKEYLEGINWNSKTRTKKKIE